eukprot:8595394-Alexandrium_andersonii.AAC.1
MSPRTDPRRSLPVTVQKSTDVHQGVRSIVCVRRWAPSEKSPAPDRAPSRALQNRTYVGLCPVLRRVLF